MHLSVKRRIESYTYTLYPSTLLLIAQWLDNGSELNEIDFYRAQWAKEAFKRYQYMGNQWEPQRFSMSRNTSEILLDHVNARLDVIAEIIPTLGMGGPETAQYMRERERLTQDRKELRKPVG